MRQATDEEIKAAFDRHLKASNLPAQIKNGDYRSVWVRQAWASFYSGWRRCEDRKMDNGEGKPTGAACRDRSA